MSAKLLSQLTININSHKIQWRPEATRNYHDDIVLKALHLLRHATAFPAYACQPLLLPNFSLSARNANNLFNTATMLTTTRSGLLSAALLTILTPLSTAAAANPGIFEIDFIYPRNTSISSSSPIPIVFALQNPDLSPILNTHIQWEVYPSGSGNTLSAPGSQSGTISLPNLNSSSNNPYLATDFMSTIIGIDNSWVFTWTLSTTNCSISSATQNQLITENTGLYFTTSHGSPAPDLVGATSSSACKNTEAFAFEVQGFRNTSSVGGTACAILAAGTTTPSPCAVSISSSQAESVAASITATICKDTAVNQTRYNITCASASGKPTSGAVATRRVEGEWMGLVTMFAAMGVGMAMML